MVLAARDWLHDFQRNKKQLQNRGSAQQCYVRNHLREGEFNDSLKAAVCASLFARDTCVSIR